MAKSHRSRYLHKPGKSHGKEGGADGYPTHAMQARNKPPHLTGSGNKTDGAYGKGSDKNTKGVVARGTGKYVISEGSRTHHSVNVHRGGKHHSVPGKTEMKVFRKNYDGLEHKVHAFRSQRQPHTPTARQGHTAHGAMSSKVKNQHSPKGTGPWYSPLRFSGHAGAHQVGKNSGGRTHFKNRQEHVWGMSPAVGGGPHTMARGGSKT